MIASIREKRPSPLSRLCRADVLSADEERRLFRQLGAVRSQVARTARASLAARPGQAHAHVRREMESIRNRIVECNLRLVVSIAKRFASATCPLEDLVSEAVLPLIHCVERFDPRRETRFSTYATRALTNFFRKRRFRESRRRSVAAAAQSGNQGKSANSAPIFERLALVDDLARLADGLAELSSRERRLVADRFGLTDGGPPRTFRELGVMHGLSKERVRVITSEALGRLKRSFSDGLSPVQATP
jgi:RNA polymerase sigma factor (sigma-70 family)